MGHLGIVTGAVLISPSIEIVIEVNKGKRNKTDASCFTFFTFLRLC